MSCSPATYPASLTVAAIRRRLLLTFFRRILSDIVQFGHTTVVSSSRLPGLGDVLTARRRSSPVPIDETKRRRAQALPLLVFLACLAPLPAAAKAKSLHAPPVPPPTLPDRNPHRAAAAVAAPAQEAAPASGVAPAPDTAALPNAPADTGTLPLPDRNPTTVTGALPLPDRNPTTVTTGALPLPDRNPTTSVPMPPASAASSVMPKTSASVSDMPLPDRNPKAPPPSLLSLGPSVLAVPTTTPQMAPSAPAPSPP